MKFLFIYNHLHLGGIETLIIRLSNWLVENNHQVEILLERREGDLLQRLHHNVSISDLGSNHEINLVQYSNLERIVSDIDVFFAFAPSLMIHTHWLFLNSQNPLKRFFVGIYHPNDYELYASSFERNYFVKHVLEEQKLFMSAPVKFQHESYFNTKFDKSRIWGLALDTRQYLTAERKRPINKIVSIGRLTDFKTYNLYMIDVVKSLKDKGYSVSYEIYGEGTLLPLIRKKIIENGLENVVYLKGNIAYEKIPSVVSDAKIFIGMGTSVIESGLMGVASIAAVPFSKEAVSHGFIHELPGYNCGEPIGGFPLFNIEEKIIQVLEMDERTLMALSSKSREVLSEKYNIDAKMSELFAFLDSDDIGQTPKNASIFLFYFSNRFFRRNWKKIKRGTKKLVKFNN